MQCQKNFPTSGILSEVIREWIPRLGDSWVWRAEGCFLYVNQCCQLSHRECFWNGSHLCELTVFGVSRFITLCPNLDSFCLQLNALSCPIFGTSFRSAMLRESIVHLVVLYTLKGKKVHTAWALCWRNPQPRKRGPKVSISQELDQRQRSVKQG